MADGHDKGLVFDLKTLASRRTTLIGLGVAGAGALVAWRSLAGGEADLVATGADGATCIKDPAETAGPFPADGTNAKNGETVNALLQSEVQRSDIRSSFNGMTAVAAGVPLTLTLTLVSVNGACAPLAGHAVYLWHCDAEGHYSLYDTPDRNYLRGLQISDAAGQVTFQTIFPACYDGRWPHMHFEVFADAAAAVSGADSILTSQLVMPAPEAAAVYAGTALYAASIGNLGDVSVAGDNVFGDNTDAQVAAQTAVLTGDAVAGFVGTVTVGVA